jgi:hypothetical protein
MAHPTRLFHEPEEMYEAWERYKQARKEEAKNWPKVQYVGKDGKRKEDSPILPLTLDGFYVFFKVNEFAHIRQYFNNHMGLYDAFVPICSRIRTEIRDQQITGGMVGMFNTSITQRLNNLTEKVEETKIKKQAIVIESSDKEEEISNKEALEDLEE